MDKLMKQALEQNKIIRYIPTFIKVMETYKKLLEEHNESFRQRNVSERSEQLVAFLKWVGDGYDFENNAEKIVKEYIDEGN